MGMVLFSRQATQAARALGLFTVGALLCAACAAEPAEERGDPPDPAADTDDTLAADGVAADPPQSTTPAAPAPSQPTPEPPKASDYETEKAWAEAHGVTIPANTVTVVARRRGDDKRSTVYEDTLVVFKKDGTVKRFLGTTKPAQMPNPSSSVVPDVDGDGRKDLGIVRPGIYKARGSTTFGIPGYERPAYKVVTADTESSGLPAWRDLTGDGIYSANEKTLSVQRKYTIGGVYIHYGFAPTGSKVGPNTYKGPWSVGCQNIQYQELDTFIAAVGGEAAIFTYAIVDDDG